MSDDIKIGDLISLEEEFGVASTEIIDGIGGEPIGWVVGAYEDEYSVYWIDLQSVRHYTKKQVAGWRARFLLAEAKLSW